MGRKFLQNTISTNRLRTTQNYFIYKKFKNLSQANSSDTAQNKILKPVNYPSQETFK